MRLAFCLLKYFPESGLARDMLRIAHRAVERGHMVDVYAREWRGDRPGNIRITLLDGGGFSNHGQAQRFARRLGETLPRLHYDAVVGFNKLPGLDFYYSADGCFAARALRRYPRAYELTPRYRTLRRLEESVFGDGARTRILLLSERAGLEYRGFYATAEERLHLLPPTLDRAHRRGPLTPGRRDAVRKSLGVGQGDGKGAGEAETLLLMVGSGFHTKGVDRAIEALAALPADLRRCTRLVVTGRGREAPYRRRAAALGVADRVSFAGGRDDVPNLLRAADLLMHPARQENTGTVILEALAAGLPVLTTANCGYAHHVRDADAGVVVEAPFEQRSLNRALLGLLCDPRHETLCDNAARYGRDEALYRMPEEAVDRIEHWRDPVPSLPFHGYVHPDLTDLSRGLPRLDDWLELEGETFRHAPDRRTVRFEHGGAGYFLKAHFGVSWKETFKNLVDLKLPVRDTRNEWLATHLLRALGVPAPVAAAWGVGPGSWQRRSFIVTRELAGMTTLEQYAVRHQSLDGAERRRRRRLIREVAAAARLMHCNGINHRDFYLCHFLFDDKRDGKLHLIDLHRAQVRHRTPRRWRVKDLGGLYYSALDAGLTPRERALFIRTYSGAASLRAALADRSFWKRVERRAHALRRAEIRRGSADPGGESAGHPTRP